MRDAITVFGAEHYSNKIPKSPFGDKTFNFQTKYSSDNLQIFNVMVSHWILNIPINITGIIRKPRRKSELAPFYFDKLTYVILDVDDVTSETNMNKVIDYFREYKCILGKSQSHDSVSNFRLKGILFIEEIDISDAKKLIQKIHFDLKEYCVIDEATSRKATFNAPIHKNEVLFNNQTGKLFKYTPVSQVQVQKHTSKVLSEYIGKQELIKVSEDLNSDSIPELCLNTFKSMGFEPIAYNENKSIQFKHPKEKKSIGGYFWFSSNPYLMNHMNSIKKVDIFDVIRKSEAGKKLMAKSINYNDELLSFNTNTNVITTNQQYLQVTDKIEETVENWLESDNGLFSIKSPMGTGKSTIINYIIQESHELDLRVLIITNRISVAVDFSKKYNMKIYNKDTYNLNDSMIVQYDSLWRYDIKNFDLVIMDEFISLMTHSRSAMNSSPLNIVKFFACFNKKLVIADAFLTGYENFLLNEKTQNQKNVVLLDNLYRDSTILYSYEDENYFVESILRHAESLKDSSETKADKTETKANKTQTHQKLTVSGTSLSFLNSLRLILEKRGFKVVLLTADTPDSTKKLIYKLFEQDTHDKFDIFLYSPSLTVGVSNLNNVKYHFHYDTSRSADVISSIQMIKRTRKAKEIHMYIANRINYIKTSYDEIRDEYMSVGNTGASDQNYIFDIDDYGNKKLSKIGKNCIKIDTFKNILEFNHKSSMMWMLKYHFRYEPRIITNTFEGNILSGAKKQLRDDTKELLNSNVKQFLELSEIEVTDLLMNSGQKIMKKLAEINDNLKDDLGYDTDSSDNNIRENILHICLKNSSFIEQCQNYRYLFNYSRNLISQSDIKEKISSDIMRKDAKSLKSIKFLNALIKLGQVEIFDSYVPKTINLPENRLKKFVLEQCGYKIRPEGLERNFIYDILVKEYYGYVRG